jgi:hypothetical protein
MWLKENLYLQCHDFAVHQRLGKMIPAEEKGLSQWAKAENRKTTVCLLITHIYISSCRNWFSQFSIRQHQMNIL